MKRVAKDPIASIPVAILVEMPIVHVPLAVIRVPFHVDGKEYFYVLFHPCHHPLNTLWVE